ncbi:ABC transporter ATP-binding protein [Halorientalis regularis]|jgi:branched-chain amino acid transport system ATP-binding protein|uniref:Amino acid/amide ABC transporter ATP-binding protein 2, HAAT family n=1 Tax=Halorientalis regularis TaxID=660518 RepID=A0A1G7NBW1_9EURY|nr:ABC transporter ATP-binding protein [Halorientalis regularis]SDF70819.1 amino acid/amide ABC transporter ATP-binding protein 2, HAAT family [Halorientalis regularis]
MSILTVDDIHTYYGQSHVLHGVSLDIESGESVALLGRNGAGKTTTLRSILGMTPPREGEITFKGEPIDGLEPYQIARRGIGIVPEERRVFPELTVGDNIDVVMDDDGEWSKDRVYDVFPALREHQDQLGGQLSGGQQQMLTIARALVTDPDLLLLDEPSEGLAPNIVADLKSLLSDVLDTGITVLLTEQNTEFAFDLAERAYILSKGDVAWRGDIETLQESDDVIGKYLSVGAVEVD